MAKLACPCGNVIWNGCDGDETVYCFVENRVLDEHPDDFAFFEVQYNGLSTEIWKCDVCDRMMFFDDPCGPVSRYMRRIDVESVGSDELARNHKSGICYNNLLFNEVDSAVSSWHKLYGKAEYDILGNPGEPDRGPLLSCRLAKELVFSNEMGRFRDWWYADMYEDLLVFYSPYMNEEGSPRPVKAWRRYSQVWPKES